MSSVLIAHSDPEVMRSLRSALKGQGVASEQVTTGAAAVKLLEKESFNVILVARDLPELSGLDVLSHVQAKDPGTRVVVLSEEDSARAAAQVLRAGAFDYLIQPVERAELGECLERALAPAPAVGSAAGGPRRYEAIIGQSKALREVLRLVEKVADTDSTIMVYGESGTGKELVARAIHESSHRRDKLLIPVNCGAIPEELLESELFGHEKGAFTSAIRTRIGRFEMADGGTIFLDEIADMSPRLQVKLLRVLQEHRFERIGGTRTIEVDIRVITATNKDLRRAMEAERFREDLYYRLNVIPLIVPPLRERPEDIPLLVAHFLKKFAQNQDKEGLSVAPEAMDALMAYPWPGNIRELENLIERMVILTEGETLTVHDLPPRIRNSTRTLTTHPMTIPEEGLDFNAVVSNFENQLLVQALEMSGWVKNKAARLLNLNRTTLVEKLKKKKIQPPQP